MATPLAAVGGCSTGRRPCSRGRCLALSWRVSACSALPPPSHQGGAQPRGELRVRVEIMGPGKYENAGKSQSVLIMINPIIFTRTRTQGVSSPHRPLGGGGCAHSGAWESHAAVPRVYTICRILNFVWVCLLMACRITARDGQRQGTKVCQPAVALASMDASHVSQSVSGCVSWQGQLWVPFWLDCCAGLSTISAILSYHIILI
eukprot:COSAG01_NODE_1741_length_9356_cov_13.065572_5_plen_204_part_00